MDSDNRIFHRRLARLALLGAATLFCGAASGATYCSFVNRDDGGNRKFTVRIDTARFKGEPVAVNDCTPSTIIELITHRNYQIPEPLWLSSGFDEDRNRLSYKLVMKQSGGYSGLAQAIIVEATDSSEVGDVYPIHLEPVDSINVIFVSGSNNEAREKIPKRKYTLEGKFNSK
ncbi:hypothetical protein N5K27_06945 [Pigmentiphaga sp. GD03639]|uniref:Uncharacterized protein n=1 Tax=Pigmentiphaga daeguensis TaxID=414049 RepID=A0ABP3MYR8_9BURK|nr:hypothetical protein [Pigmentiphaga sp. GD03639]MDH2236031.1 hypothetical protein [Pigmentiphaga sp. GD03639]